MRAISAASCGGGATLSRLRNFRPFHSMGLCEAVATMAASALRCLIIMAAPGVETISRSVTSTPLATSAATAESRTQGPERRLSRAKMTRRGSGDLWDLWRKAAKAEAMRVMTAGVREAPTVPRIPEIPIMSADSMGGDYGFAGWKGKGYALRTTVQSINMDRNELNHHLPDVVNALVKSIGAQPRMQRSEER